MEEKKVIEMLTEKQAELDALLKVLHPDVDRVSVAIGPSLLRNMSKQDIFNRVEEFGIDVTIQANNDSEYMRDLVVDDRFKMLMSGDDSDNDSIVGLLIETLGNRMKRDGEGFVTRDGVIKSCIIEHLSNEINEMSEGDMADIFYRETMKKMKSQYGRLLELHKDIEYMKDPKERLIGRLMHWVRVDQNPEQQLHRVRELAMKNTVNIEFQDMCDRTEDLGGSVVREAEFEYVRVISEHACDDNVTGDSSIFREEFVRGTVKNFDDCEIQDWLKKLG